MRAKPLPRRSLSAVVAALIGLGGCAGISPVQVGQTAGTITGAVIAPGVGASLGALVGMVAGMVVQGEMDRTTARKERIDLGRQLAGSPATDQPPEEPLQGTPTRVWVDETLQNGRLIPGHFDTRLL